MSTAAYYGASTQIIRQEGYQSEDLRPAEAVQQAATLPEANLRPEESLRVATLPKLALRELPLLQEFLPQVVVVAFPL